MVTSNLRTRPLGKVLAAAFAVLFLVAAEAVAQTLRPGTVRIAVADFTELPIPGATVTLTSPDGSTQSASTTERGQAVFARVPAGQYTAHVEMPGFRAADFELTVRAGATVTRNVQLQIAAIVEQLDVAPAADEARLADPFASDLTLEQIESLPEDPNELAAYLQQLVGDDVEIRVDGFDASLPPGAVIEEVRIRYDTGAADGDGRPRVEIRTRPGADGWRNHASVQIRDDSLNARNAFSEERPNGLTRRFAWNVNGPLVRNRTGIEVSFEGRESLEQQAIRALTPAGIVSSLAEQPSTRLGFSARVDHAVNKAHTLRLDVRRRTEHAQNQGVGEFDFPERAYQEEGATTEIRASHRAAITRTVVNDLRVELEHEKADLVSRSEDTTIRVLDAFTAGGAQVRGGRRSTAIEMEDELKFTLGRQHEMTTGFDVEGTHVSGDEFRNATGTFTFASLEDYEAGRPTTFTQRVGDPSFEYSMYHFSWYVQDDWRVRPDLVLNLGLRHDFQTHLDDAANFAPRVGFNWIPNKELRTAIRGSVGVFYQPFDTGLYQQTVVVNGRQQRDIVIVNPSFPGPFLLGTDHEARPSNIIRLAPVAGMPYTSRVNIGVDQPVGKSLRLRATYSRRVGRDQFRSVDANAPIGGARPDPLLGIITELGTFGRSSEHSLELRASINQRPRRFTSEIRYRLGEALNDTDNPLTLTPNSFDLASEWGPARQDIRHRLNISVTTEPWTGFRINANFRASSGAPYTVTTGEDVNGDGVNNERPAGIGRNSARGDWTRVVDIDVAWGRGYGKRSAPAGSMQGRGGDGGRRGGRRAGSSGSNAFRFEIYASGSNVLNTVNPQRYSGVITSEFFGQPTSAGAARRLHFGTRFWF